MIRHAADWAGTLFIVTCVHIKSISSTSMSFLQALLSNQNLSSVIRFKKINLSNFLSNTACLK